MKTVYERTVSGIGECARETFDDGFIILFDEEQATDDMAEYCFLHQGEALKGDFAIGDTLTINGKAFSITAIGNNAFDNLRDLGHITLYFDGAEEAKLPGCVHVFGTMPQSDLAMGAQLSINVFE